MKRKYKIILFVASVSLLLIGGFVYYKLSTYKEMKSVAEMERLNSKERVTPKMLKKNPIKYRGVSLSWFGKVKNIKEAPPENVWVFKEIADSKYGYFGKTEMRMRLNSEGRWDADSWGLGYLDSGFNNDKFIYDGEAEVFEGDIIKIEASVIGYETEGSGNLLFAIAEISKVDKDGKLVKL